MRNVFAEEIARLASRDPRVVLLSGDIGNRLFDSFKQEFPERFYNCGVAEANMIGVAAGLAMGGLRPVVYTIAAFATVRCLEQIRVDLCCQHLPVIVVGVGGGLAYAENGPTHHCCEDLAMLRVLPGMTVLCPADSWELRALLPAALAQDGPVYLRIGKKGEPLVHAQVPSLAIGQGLAVRHGTDVCLIATGTVLPLALAAAELIEGRGLSAGVLSFPTVKPLDESLLNDACGRFPLVVTVEEHSALGGLGGAVAEWLAGRANRASTLLRLGTGDWYLHEAGGQAYARERYGLSPEQIAAAVERAHASLMNGLPAGRRGSAP